MGWRRRRANEYQRRDPVCSGLNTGARIPTTRRSLLNLAVAITSAQISIGYSVRQQRHLQVIRLRRGHYEQFAVGA